METNLIIAHNPLDNTLPKSIESEGFQTRLQSSCVSGRIGSRWWLASQLLPALQLVLDDALTPLFVVMILKMVTDGSGHAVLAHPSAPLFPNCTVQQSINKINRIVI